MIRQAVSYALELLAFAVLAVLVGIAAGWLWALLPAAVYLSVVAVAIRFRGGKP